MTTYIMPPKAKARKPKKPVLQKQKQKQSQRVVVNINQEKAKRRRAGASKPRQAQPSSQVNFQPLITMTGSVPVPQPYYNPAPIQSSGGFIPMPSIPAGLGSPLEVPVFKGETPKVIGDEEVSVRASVPVSRITPVSRREEPIIIQQPPPRPEQPLIVSAPSVRSPQQVFSDTEEFLRKRREATASVPNSQFISQPPSVKSDSQSISSLFSEISKDTGITSEKIAKKLFGKKEEPPPLAVRSPVRIQVPKSDISESSDSASSVGFDRIYPASVSSDEFFTSPMSADILIGDKSDAPPESISTRGGFTTATDKSSIKSRAIINPPKAVILEKPVLRRARRDIYNPFEVSDDEGLLSDKATLGGQTRGADTIASNVGTAGTKKKKEKREVTFSSGSERDMNIIPQEAPAGRRLPTVKEKKSNYQSLSDLQFIAKGKDISLTRATGKKKTREELRQEIMNN